MGGGITRKIGANIENYKFRLHERILGAYIPCEAKIIYYILLNRIAIHICGRGDVVRTGPLHISNIGHA